MKLIVLCLLAVCCSSLAASTNRNDIAMQKRKLTEVLRQLNDVKETLQHSERMLHTPPQNIEDCCCLSALKCFRANLQVQFNVTDRKQGKLYRSLGNNITERGLDFCQSGTATSTCQDCASHPKENAKEFFTRLESLIQRAMARLTMN